VICMNSFRSPVRMHHRVFPHGEHPVRANRLPAAARSPIGCRNRRAHGLCVLTLGRSMTGSPCGITAGEQRHSLCRATRVFSIYIYRNVSLFIWRITVENKYEIIISAKYLQGSSTCGPMNRGHPHVDQWVSRILNQFPMTPNLGASMKK